MNRFLYQKRYLRHLYGIYQNNFFLVSYKIKNSLIGQAFNEFKKHDLFSFVIFLDFMYLLF